MSERRDLSHDRRGGHGCTREGLCLGVLLREDGVAQVAQARQAVPHVQVSHEPAETEHTRKPTASARAKRCEYRQGEGLSLRPLAEESMQGKQAFISGAYRIVELRTPGHAGEDTEEILQLCG